MQHGQGANTSNGSGAAILLVVAGAALAVVWVGAQLAALIAGRHLGAGLSPTFHALVRLPANADHPSAAWGPPWEGTFGSPTLYWACTGFAAVLAAIGAGFGLRFFGRHGVGTEDRKRLGVDTKARLGSARDLKPLVVKRPTPGRLILGRVDGRLVATELRDPKKPPRPGGRAGDRSAVALIGPSRCGKSADIISAILEWEGPAILSSVKGDLLEATVARRERLDGSEIKIFDPTQVIKGRERSQWSPVAKCASVTGAMKLAHALGSANPDSLPHDGYFKVMAEQLLWPLLFT
ncbi:MAG TPA: type IV secretory system conjugative DNA transfer family protein, partial [Acidimicrobiales bacterium]